MSRTARSELALVLLTALAHLLTVSRPGLHLVVVVLAVLGWGAWLGHVLFTDPGARARLGLGRQGLLRTLDHTVPLVVFTVIGCAILGFVQGQLSLPWTLPVMLLLYPLWGLVQQVLVQGIVVHHLARALPGRRALVALLGGLLFGLVHLNIPALALATFAMGTAFAWVFQRHRHTVVLGLWHGWLGAVFYLWVLGHDPIAYALAA